MAKVKVTICKEEIIEIPDEVYKDLSIDPRDEETNRKWVDAGNYVVEQLGVRWAYEGTGLRKIESLDGEIFAEA